MPKPTPNRKTTKRKPARSKRVAHTLTQIETSGLIAESDPAPELAYRFKHTLTQETAYQSLLVKNRRAIHRAIAECYEEIGAPDLDAYAALLAQHYAQAGDDAKTIAYSIRAGDAAARVFALPEATMQYARGLDAAKRTSPPASSSESGREVLSTLYRKSGRVLELAGRYDDAASVYEEMETIAREKRDRALELAALIYHSTILCTPTAKFDAVKGEQVCQRALALARELHDMKSEARALWNQMLLLGVSGRAQEALPIGEKALALARAAGLKEQLAYTLSDLGSFIYSGIGDLHGAIAAQDEARAIWRELDNPAMLADNLAGTAQNLLMIGESARALEYTREAFAISARIDNLWGKAYSLLTESLIQTDLHWGRCVHALEEAANLADQCGFVGGQMIARCELALVYALLGEFGRARNLAEQGHAVAEAKIPIWRSWSYSVLARVSAQSQEWDHAEKYLRAALDVFNPNNTTLFSIIYIPLAQGEIALGRGDYTRVIQTMEECLQTIARLQYLIFAPEALYLQARAWRAQGDETHARAILNAARTQAEVLNGRRVLWQILAALGEKENARAMLFTLVADLPDDLRAGFFATDDVRELME